MVKIIEIDGRHIEVDDYEECPMHKEHSHICVHPDRAHSSIHVPCVSTYSRLCPLKNKAED